MANTPFLDLVKPAGTDRALVSVINSNSDKIDTGVSTLSEQIANAINDFGSKTIAGMNTAIEGKLSSMSVGESVSFKVTLTDTDSVFTSSGAHTGIATKSADSRINATLIRSGTSTVGYYCGTKTSNGWVWQELARNLVINATSYDYSDKAGWDYAYSQLGTSYNGVVYLQFNNNYMLTCIAMRQSESWGSILGIMNDNKLPYYYTVRSGPTSKLVQLATIVPYEWQGESGFFYRNSGSLVELNLQKSFSTPVTVNAYSTSDTIATISGYSNTKSISLPCIILNSSNAIEPLLISIGTTGTVKLFNTGSGSKTAKEVRTYGVLVTGR